MLTPHHVVPPRENDRYSFACNPPKFPPQTYWQFFDWYMKNSYTHYGKLKTRGNNEVEA